MREIVLDTETTGIKPEDGHRLVEIGCLELENHVPTGQVWHEYINPERDMPEEAFRVHGLSTEVLSTKPLFADIADSLLGFLKETPLIIHNAEFDMKFLNYELRKAGRPTLPASRAVDTLQMAREKYGSVPINLDALCRRFGIDNSARTYHGALLDAELLAEVYLQLCGGREPDLGLGADATEAAEGTAPREYREPRPHAATSEELVAHAAFVKKLKNPIWNN